MNHAFIKCLIHIVFSTKNRERWIHPSLELELWSYIAGITNKRGIKSLVVGGVEDHIHVLVSLPPTVTIAQTAQYIKGGSSKWLHEKFPDLKGFQWQNGYSAFSVGMKQLKTTITYIKNQREHHEKQSFEEEIELMMVRHGYRTQP